MKKYLIILFVFMLAAGSWSVAQDETIPITTSSEKASELYLQAIEALGNAEIDTAKQLLNEALKEDPDFFRANLTLALISLNPDNQGEFKEYAEKAINTKSDLSDGEMLIKKALTRLNENPQADVTDVGEELIELYPKDESVYNLQAMLQNLIKDYKGSEKTYSDLLKITRNPGPVYNQMGYTYMNMGNLEAAQKAFDQYIELVPNHPNPYDSKGDYYMVVKDYKNAYESYIKAHEINEAWSYEKALKAKELMEKSAVSESQDKQ